ncbi:hypothetical protein GH714_031332 [Hevea brasiliensis]|uniref:Uncharacterized protein n=1 Tax=Hevea brasiliensis TaxID=3981 RepID=A0A6A6M5D2_HEVBR|nr:hypothetical protein GH714_031332 [Hevea brasiliensis]
MNVESFSQLPFIRPAPVKEKGIRLFGIEFGGNDTSAAADESASAETNEDSSTPNPPMSYPSWNSHPNNSRFYGSHGSYSQQPINGSPLGLWRIPAVHGSATLHRDRSVHPLPLFAGEELKPSQVSGSSSQGRYGYESKPSVQDHVSLDLHL